jgi:hypothetical protein
VNAFQINRQSDWYGTVSRPVDVRSKNLDFMPSRRQCLAEAMSCENWPSIAHSRQIGWDDVEDPHKLALQGLHQFVSIWLKQLDQGSKSPFEIIGKIWVRSAYLQPKIVRSAY